MRSFLRCLPRLCCGAAFVGDPQRASINGYRYFHSQPRFSCPQSPLPLTWNALQEIKVQYAKTDNDEPSLDATLDFAGYQLFRDGLLPSLQATGYGMPDDITGKMTHAMQQKLQKGRDAAVANIRKNGVVLRRSIKETAIVIGCDEAGRGPLAGPVVGAAVCRIPMSSFNNEYAQLYDALEQFQIFDSKSVSECQRNLVFAMITGHADFFNIAANKKFIVHHCGSDQTSSRVFASKSIESHARLGRLPFKKILSMQIPFLVTLHGYNSAGNYLYLWSIGIANHTYIDIFNIHRASMNCMHRSAFAVWHMLNDTRFSYEVAPRPKYSSIARYLFSRFCTVAGHDHEKRYMVPRDIDLIESPSDDFDFEPIQPPLVLIDGHTVPKQSYDYFTDLSIGGKVHPIIEGDKRSLSIAAASCLAKVTRDELMSYLDGLYPDFCFADNKGYPVEQHMKHVAQYGLCPVHRKSFRPCKDFIEKQGKNLL
ncbi:unnamed protein product [Phytomonas sp. Hart1]|nr:unnamed protein product [Phytomonas sp. Hart1]|eukprot:CCW67106.1 unnamed protein product [Phytomonas sp. isolate Hart1]